jgi:hypothetical protein
MAQLTCASSPPRATSARSLPTRRLNKTNATFIWQYTIPYTHYRAYEWDIRLGRRDDDRKL